MSLSTIESAERGHPQAIAAVVKHVLTQKKLADRVTVRVLYKVLPSSSDRPSGQASDHSADAPADSPPALVIFIRTPTKPDATLCLKVVRHLLQRLTIHRFVPTVVVCGQIDGRKSPVWSKRIGLSQWSSDTAIAPLLPENPPANQPIAPSSPAARPSVSSRFHWRNLGILLAVLVAVGAVLRMLGGLLSGGMVGVPNGVASVLRPMTRFVSQRANAALAGMQPPLEKSLPTDWSRLLPVIEPPPLPANLTLETVTIAAVGDIVPGTNYPETRLPNRPEDLFVPTADALRSADLTFGNFESVLTDAQTPSKDVSQPTTFAFRAPPFFAEAFKLVGFDVLNVANNHSFDFGERGLSDTYRHFNEVGIDLVGDRTTILVRNVNNVNVAFLAFSPYAAHNSVNDLDRAREIVQEIALLGLWRGGFFEHAAFYGGTALRIFHGLRRFSEDLDFTLLASYIGAKFATVASIDTPETSLRREVQGAQRWPGPDALFGGRLRRALPG
ncbi:MAG: hypothetical protein HC795_12700 [Coleofasciculaceae cyanobacterium RL_1_1]|nr:hypothetical protein [Coleofasciculaceae cyanobacterium RL_1_1]